MMEVPSVIARFNAHLDQELRAILDQRTGLLYQMMLYQLGWVDEQGAPSSGTASQRLHSTLCLLSCEALGKEHRAALPAAAALELVHQYSLIHNDVKDGSPQRQGRPSVWWVWGPGQAINAGDGMHALGRLALLRLADLGLSAARVLQALRVLDTACLKLCEGQHADLVFQERLEITSDNYFRMAQDKSGALMGCATELGALIATEDPVVAEAFRHYGINLGVAFQIRKDISDLWPEDGDADAAPEVLNKNKLFPIVWLLEQGDLKTKREVGTLYFKRVLEPADAERLRRLLDEKGVREIAQATARKYYEQGIKALEPARISPSALQAFEELGQYMVSHAK